ncbi:hypothetical protein DSM104299_04219 [Baekduia alba]|uniref:calcium-binding protein n=1 Tax=Baekduia alba TaxID=2997333 RepID=UPI0023422795|nr:calcium-binding protein [Baekduia alba]WCB95472.1 hypothetical protein DSM104299_04219 [Baekduia alba]
MPIRFVLLGVVVLCVLPAAVAASTVSSDGSTVTFRSGADRSDLVMTVVPQWAYAVVDTASPLRAGTGCRVGPPVACPGLDVDVALGPGDDRSSVLGFFSQLVRGGEGNDMILAGGQTTVVYGGPGDDSLRLSANGSGSGYGNDGNDSLYGRGSAITLAGGDGDDLAVAEGETESVVSGNDGFDTVTAYVGRHSGRATLTGGDGYDLIAVLDDGTAHPGDSVSTLEGGPGDDTMLGGPGRDGVAGGAGNDAIDVSGDGAADTVECGGGYDIVWHDPEDTVARNCEGRRDGPMTHTADVDEKLAAAAQFRAALFEQSARDPVLAPSAGGQPLGVDPVLRTVLGLRA